MMPCMCQHGPPGLPGPPGNDGKDGIDGQPGRVIITVFEINELLYLILLVFFLKINFEKKKIFLGSLFIKKIYKNKFRKKIFLKGSSFFKGKLYVL